ncbi:MAG: xylulokinase, partial [Clostridia bacterium]|nr:xylulokinase [Clostridia bacterium]
MYYIGVDLGTSSVKLLLLSENGIEKTASRSYPVEFPRDGWSQQNPADWMNGVCEAMNELLADVDKSQVQAISFGGQMHGLVLLDEQNEVIRPAILWNDTRTAPQTDYLNNVVGKDFLLKNCGNIAFAGFTAPKVLWVKENEPENFARIHKMLLPKDYVAFCLCGNYATDVSDASGTLYFDVEHRCWSKPMLDVLGVTEEQLPTVYESHEVVGTLTSAMAERFGLSENVKIVAGAGDNAAAAIGNHIINDGDCNLSVGTSGTVFVSSDKYAADTKNAIHMFCHANGKYHSMACMLSAASCNGWWAETILGTNDFKTEESAMDIAAENPVLFLPYLMGERSPLNDPDVRGMFYGMSLATTRAQMGQAVLEGVAFAFRHNIEIIRSSGITVNKAKICGGGAKSPLWRKILSDSFGINVKTLESDEGPALGAAILGGCAAGIYSSVEEG